MNSVSSLALSSENHEIPFQPLQSLRTLNYTHDGRIDYSNLFPLSHEAFPAFHFEKLSFEFLSSVGNFMYQYWYFSLVVGICYLAAAFFLQHYMRNYEPIKLKWTLFIWNMAIGIFSIVGFIRTAPPVLYRLSEGFYTSVCHINPMGEGQIFWALLYTLSKYPQLIDTLFLVLRKKPLEPSQWFHHVSVLIGATLFLPTIEPFTMYLVAVNYGVHSLMYPYLGLRVIGFRPPAFVAKFIASCEFIQFLIAFCVNTSSAVWFLSGYRYCHRNPRTIWFTFLLNFSYFIIFGQVLYRVLSRSAPEKKTK